MAPAMSGREFYHRQLGESHLPLQQGAVLGTRRRQHETGTGKSKDPADAKIAVEGRNERGRKHSRQHNEGGPGAG